MTNRYPLPRLQGLVLVISATLLSMAQAKSGYEVMDQVRQQSRIHLNQQYDVFMNIQDSRKRTRKRYFTSWNKYNEGEDLGLIRFYKPANLSGTGMLSKKETGEVSHQWIYLPAFRSIKKLSQSDREKSFMGSDFSNADIGGRGLHEDDHKLVSEDEKNYYVTSTPKSAENTYSRIEYKILKSPLVVRRVKFYDHNNQLIKVLSSNKIKAYKGMYIVIDSVMKNPNTNSQSSLIIENVKLNLPKPNNFYSTKGLKQ